VTAEQDSGFSGASQRLNLITTELQEGVMKTRMQPIGNVWSKLPRVVRDLSLACGKQVELDLVGQDTELDKTIIEAIKDPLTHLVRNAVDHGLEAPEVRLAGGKPAVGRLALRAFHEGGQVNIEIADDGAGIDTDRVKAKAVQHGVITAEQASRLADREALDLIFAAGFSTAETVTNVSGRGVGMDVVRTNIERIGGTVDVHTERGVGTTFRVKIPLTLAIVPALIVSSGGDRYAIPQLSLIELVRLEGDAARAGIELVHGAPVHRLRGRLLPIVDLAGELARGSEGLEQREVTSIVVLHADGHRFGLVVDDIHDTQEIVVKPLGSHLKDATLFAGATIMGDGCVSLILDVLGIAERARVVAASRERGTVAERDGSDAPDPRRALLLVAVGDDRRAAIALSDVERLEEFPVDAVEWAGSREVVQYRDAILPLVRLGDALGFGRAFEPDLSVSVVVHSVGEHKVGVVVGRVLDIVEQEVSSEASSERAGLLGSTVIQGRVTDVVDVHAIVTANDPAAFGGGPFGAQR
jgi:two-component system, chemotaxis family, sensor kinase CheA